MRVDFEGKSVNLADVIIPGAAKSGTTSIAYCLNQHPEICMPRKEPGFFYFYNRNDLVRKGAHHKRIITLDDYIALNKNVKPGQKILDASTKYLYTYNDTIRNIKKFYGKNVSNIKIIIILRNPVERAFSHFLYYKKLNFEPHSFKEAIKPSVARNRSNYFNYLENGLYFKQVKKYLEEFSQVKIFLYEDLSNIQELLVEMFNFIGINPNAKIDTSVKANPSGIPKSRLAVKLLEPDKGIGKYLKIITPFSLHPKFAKARYFILQKFLVHPGFPEELRSEIVSYFRDDILSLQKLIKRDLSSWFSN